MKCNSWHLGIKTARLDLLHLTVCDNNPFFAVTVQSLGSAPTDAVYAEVIRPQGRHTGRKEDIKGRTIHV